MHRLTEFEKQQINALYEQGKMDSEIGKELGICRATICYYRQTHNMPTKFTYDKISKIDNQKFEKLFNQGLSDYVIAKELNMSPEGVYSHRMRHKYIRTRNLRVNEAIELSDFQKQVLIGTMLGDSSMSMSKSMVSPKIVCMHGVKQKEYCEHKTQIFKSLGAHCTYHKRSTPDLRTGICYENYTMSVPANPEFLKYYEAFYRNGIKRIPLELLDNFTEVSLAFMYMDDGCKISQSYSIATNCFTVEEINKFRAFLLSKFNLETSIFKSHILYIRAKSKGAFESLIKPYIIPCMQYKLHD